MPQEITGYRVFVASPGGLKTERDCFRKVLEEYNRTDAFRRNVAFIPVGWEKLAPTRGRGQEVINQQLRKCDYCVVVLHDRWGMPPADDGEYTSGTEEEYGVASECLADERFPMKDIAVFFKHVEPSKLSDPGPQLQKVLDFKKKLETSRVLMFQTFESEEDFAELLRTAVAEWLFSHENPEDGVASANSEPAADASQPQGSAGGGILAEAAALQASGRFSQAETLLAAASAAGDDAEADIAYAELLAQTRRWRQAEASFSRGIGLAEMGGNAALRARGLLGLGKLFETTSRGDRTKAIETLREAISLAGSAGPPSMLAEAWAALGQSLRNEGDIEGALKAYTRAEAAVAASPEEAELSASIWLGRGEVYRDLSRFDDARVEFERAIDLHARQGKDDADALAGLGSILEVLGDLPAAEDHFLRSLHLFSAERDWNGIADVTDHLGRIRESQGKLEEAAEDFERSAEAFELLHNLQAAADACLSGGRVALARGYPQQARALYEQALGYVNRLQGGATTSDMVSEILGNLEALPA